MKKNIAVIGLGYVGLPLAVTFGKIYPVIGFDINHSRIKKLLEGEMVCFGKHGLLRALCNIYIFLSENIFLVSNLIFPQT